MDIKSESEGYLAAVMEDIRWYINNPDLNDEGDDVHSPINDYGLEWSHEITDHRNHRQTWRLLLAYGGPTYGFLVTFHDDLSIRDVEWFFGWGSNEYNLNSHDLANRGVNPNDDFTALETFFDSFYSWTVNQ